MEKHDNHFVEPEELQAWLDNELEPARQRTVTAHVAECHQCATLAEDLKRVSATLQQWDVEEAPASLRLPVVEDIRPWHSLLRLRPIFALAGAAAIVLIIAAVSIPNLLRSKMDANKPAEMARTRELSEINGLTGEADKQAAPAPEDSPKAQIVPPTSAPGKKPLQKTVESKDEAVTIDGASRGAIGAVVGGIPQRSPEARNRAIPETKANQKNEAVGELADAMDAIASTAPEEVAAEEVAELRSETSSRMARKEAPALALEPAAPQSGAGAFAQDRFALRRKLKQAADLERRLLSYRINMGLEVKDFDAARRQVESLVAGAGGYLQDSRVGLQHNQKQKASFHLRVPNDNLQDILKELRALGKVTHENMTTEELTDQLIDIEARQRNSRNTEERLLTLQKTAEMDMKQSLAVEREISRVRSEIERREAQRQAMLGRAAMASIHLELIEEFNSQIEGAGTGSFRQIRNSAAEGYNGFTGMLLALATFFARWGLHLVFWFFLGKLLWRFWLRGSARTFQLNQL